MLTISELDQNSKKMREAYLKSRRDFWDEKKRQNKMVGQRAELESNLPNLERAVEDFRARKDQVFEKELTGEVDGQAVELAKKALTIAEEELSDCKEKIGAIVRLAKNNTERIANLQQAEITAMGQFWDAVYENLKSEIQQDKVSQLIDKAVAVKSCRGMNRVQTLCDLFGAASIEKNHKIKKELELEFFAAS